MRDALIPWGRMRWPGCRVMEELAVGGHRIDLVFVQTEHLAGVEIKSSLDTLDRLDGQIKEFSACIPDLWLAYAPKWLPEMQGRDAKGFGRVRWSVGQVLVEDGKVKERLPAGRYAYPHSSSIDGMLTAPMLHILWRPELMAVAKRFGVGHKKRANRRVLMETLARGLTGADIVRSVCGVLRGRRTGWQADAPAAEVSA